MLIINQRREVEVMSNLMRKTLSTLKNEGVVSLTNKTYNYINIESLISIDITTTIF